MCAALHHLSRSWSHSCRQHHCHFGRHCCCCCSRAVPRFSLLEHALFFGLFSGRPRKTSPRLQRFCCQTQLRCRPFATAPSGRRCRLCALRTPEEPATPAAQTCIYECTHDSKKELRMASNRSLRKSAWQWWRSKKIEVKCTKRYRKTVMLDRRSLAKAKSVRVRI